MKSKKLSIALVFVLIFFMINILAFSNISYAQNPPLYLGITELKLESGMGYAIGNPNSGGTTNRGAKIWNIIQYQSETSNTYSENNIYCLKAGVGFSDVHKRAIYDVFYDMKAQKTAIQGQNEILRGLVEGTMELDDGTTISQYSAILAALDLFYYNKTSDESEREALLQAAGVPNYTYNLTDDEYDKFLG